MSDLNFAAESEDLLRRAIRCFAKWASENWSITVDEAETLTKPTTSPVEYARGYNDAIRSIADAAGLWMEDEP